MKLLRTGAILVAGAMLAGSPCLPAQTTQKKAAQPLRSAPDFTRKSLDGKTVRLSDYRGKVVLLNFWATWCGPCIEEIPRFSAWQTKYGSQGLQVIGISMDDDVATVQKFNRKHQLTYPVVMGDEHLGELYGGVLGLPITYLIGSDGKIIARYMGETDLNQMETRIGKLLQSKDR